MRIDCFMGFVKLLSWCSVRFWIWCPFIILCLETISLCLLLWWLQLETLFLPYLVVILCEDHGAVLLLARQLFYVLLLRVYATHSKCIDMHATWVSSIGTNWLQISSFWPLRWLVLCTHHISGCFGAKWCSHLPSSVWNKGCNILSLDHTLDLIVWSLDVVSWIRILHLSLVLQLLLDQLWLQGWVIVNYLALRIVEHVRVIVIVFKVTDGDVVIWPVRVDLVTFG